MRRTCVLGIVAAMIFAWSASARAAAPLPADVMAAALGARLTAQGEVLRASWPREDVKVTVDRVPLAAAAGLTSWVAFTPAKQGALVMGDTVVFQDEIDAAMDAALAAGLSVTALHNHFSYDQPRVSFLHFSGMGDAKQLATGVRTVWDAIRAVRSRRAVPAWGFGGPAPSPGSVDEKAIGRIMGRIATPVGNVVKVETGTEGTLNGVAVGDAMGLNTWAAFQGNDDRAAVDGDFAMTGAEVQPVLKALRKGRIHVVALHNHMIGEEPRLYFLHFWGEGSAEDLARTLKSALDAQQAAARQ